MRGIENLDMEAPEGQVWVCQACGKTAAGIPQDLMDSSCVLHSVLCYKQDQGPQHWVAVPELKEN